MYIGGFNQNQAHHRNTNYSFPIICKLVPYYYQRHPISVSSNYNKIKLQNRSGSEVKIS